MTPIVDGLEAAYQGRVTFQRIDADRGAGPTIIREYHILGHPTILIINQEGKEVNRLVGPQSAEDLDEILQQVLASSDFSFSVFSFSVSRF